MIAELTKKKVPTSDEERRSDQEEIKDIQQNQKIFWEECDTKVRFKNENFARCQRKGFLADNVAAAKRLSHNRQLGSISVPSRLLRSITCFLRVTSKNKNSREPLCVR